MTQQGRVKLLPSILLRLLASHEYPDIVFLISWYASGFTSGETVNHGLRVTLQEGFRYVEGDYLFPWRYPVS